MVFFFVFSCNFFDSLNCLIFKTFINFYWYFFIFNFTLNKILFNFITFTIIVVIKMALLSTLNLFSRKSFWLNYLFARILFWSLLFISLTNSVILPKSTLIVVSFLLNAWSESFLYSSRRAFFEVCVFLLRNRFSTLKNLFKFSTN